MWQAAATSEELGHRTWLSSFLMIYNQFVKLEKKAMYEFTRTSVLSCPCKASSTRREASAAFFGGVVLHATNTLWYLQFYHFDKSFSQSWDSRHMAWPYDQIDAPQGLHIARSSWCTRSNNDTKDIFKTNSYQTACVRCPAWTYWLSPSGIYIRHHVKKLFSQCNWT